MEKQNNMEEITEKIKYAFQYNPDVVIIIFDNIKRPYGKNQAVKIAIRVKNNCYKIITLTYVGEGFDVSFLEENTYDISYIPPVQKDENNDSNDAPLLINTECLMSINEKLEDICETLEQIANK